MFYKVVYVWSGPMRVRWGTFGSLPTIFGMLPNVVKRQGASSKKASHYWQFAIVAGKVPNKKKSHAEASRDSAMRGAPLHVYYILFGQYTHPIGSVRPPWAAGEYQILKK